MAKNPDWSETEIQVIRDNIHLHSTELIKLLPGRDREAMLKKMKKLGLFDADTHTVKRTQVGDKFNRLTVLEMETRVVRGIKKRFALVRCDCEAQTEKWVSMGELRGGTTKSCGCWSREQASAHLYQLSRRTDITEGQQYSRWTVIAAPFYKEFGGAQQQFVLCRCSCEAQTEREVKCSSLRNGRTNSCGCLIGELASKRRKRHGKSRTLLYHRWTAMRQRCADESLPRYGGRGITICPEWDAYEAFEEWALTNGYRDELEIDRIDYDGNYEPSNCRWVDRATQMNNRRTTRWITFQGETKTAKQWSQDERCEVSYQVLLKRLKAGEPFEVARLNQSVKRKPR